MNDLFRPDASSLAGALADAIASADALNQMFVIWGLGPDLSEEDLENKVLLEAAYLLRDNGVDVQLMKREIYFLDGRNGQMAGGNDLFTLAIDGEEFNVSGLLGIDNIVENWRERFYPHLRPNLPTPHGELANHLLRPGSNNEMRALMERPIGLLVAQWQASLLSNDDPPGCTTTGRRLRI